MMLRGIIALILAACAIAQPATTYPEWLNRGVQAYKAARYDEAIAAFEQATRLQPASVEAHLYLATAHMTQWIPGADSADNEQRAQRARSGFETVLSLDANHVIAMTSLASLAFNEAASKADPIEKSHKLDEASRYYQRLIGLDPRNREAHYSLGVIAWTRFYPALQAARASLGMRPEDPGPLPDAGVRQQLRNGYERTVEDGIRHFETALQIDPQYDDAMAYLNLLIRERADWRESGEEYKRDVAIADGWVQKALDTKKSKVQTGALVVRAVAPPPSQPLTETGAIRVGADVQAALLVTKVDPVYPPLARQARVQGVVRFAATIDANGRVSNLQLQSGHPLLVPAAQEAARQWVYRPTVLNGQAVEVQTTIEVPFRSSR